MFYPLGRAPDALYREGHGAPLAERVEGTLDLAHKLFVRRCRSRRNERRER